MLFPSWTLLLWSRHLWRKSGHYIGRFPWHRGIQKCYVIAKEGHEEGRQLQCLYSCFTMLSDQWETVVLFVPFASDCQGHVAHESVSFFPEKHWSCDQYWRWMQRLNFLQFDWYHQHFSDVHKKQSKVTRRSPPMHGVNIWPTRLHEHLTWD